MTDDVKLPEPDLLDGWVRVPVEPTQAMFEAAFAFETQAGGIQGGDLSDAWAAMLAARPEAPTVAQKPLTRAQISRASGDAQIAFCLNKQPTYEVAFAREVERLHGIGKEGGA